MRKSGQLLLLTLFSSMLFGTALSARSNIEIKSFPLFSSTTPRFWVDALKTRGSDQNTLVEISYSIVLGELAFTKDNDNHLASFKFTAQITDSTGQVVKSETRQKSTLVTSSADLTDETRGIVDQFTIALPPGNYTAHFSFFDINSQKSSDVESGITIAEYSDDLWLSDIQLAAHISTDVSNKAFVKANRTILPNPARRYRHQNSYLYLYFELYNLVLSADSLANRFSLQYAIMDAVGDSLIIVPPQAVTKPADFCTITQALDIRALDEGDHWITITASDIATGQSVSKKSRFTVHKPIQPRLQLLSMEADDIKKYRAQIQYFATPQELELFDALAIEDKETFLVNFWRSKDPDPDQPGNQFMQDAISRIDYAYKHFSGKKDGLNSDMGRVFVVYGQPDDIERFTMDFSMKPHIIWHYFTGRGQQTFVFVDHTKDGIYDLVHSTVEEEINNPDWKNLEIY